MHGVDVKLLHLLQQRLRWDRFLQQHPGVLSYYNEPVADPYRRCGPGVACVSRSPRDTKFKDVADVAELCRCGARMEKDDDASGRR